MTTANSVGIRLDDGDLVLDKGGIELVSGLPNLAQALQIRVLTALGEDGYDTRYGFDYRAVFTAPASAHEMRDLLRLNIVRTLGTDHRVQEIRDVQVIDPQLDAHHRQWAVVVSIITSDGTPAVLKANIGAQA
ncbi:hypothetical protein [Nocardia sp. CA-120079]|uniref:hypothetical protein n=1 Tax=Nocardia sp. CA-120079 TaxID=3239974 RepID=UPI003D9854ED